MSHLRRWVAIALVIVLSFTLAACSLDQFKTKEAQVPTLVTSSLSDPKTFNTVVSQESNPTFQFTGEGLTTTNGITGDIEPALAESWEFSEDNKRIVFTLRKGLKWSDGHPLTAEDVVFTYRDVYLNEKIPTDARDILRIGTKGLFPTIRKIDDLHVEFVIPEPFAPFLRVTGIGLLPAHILKDAVTTLDIKGNPKFISMWGVDTSPSKIVVAGPYQIESYRTSERVVLRRNPNYWRKDDEGNPQPYIERMAIEIVESQDTDLLQFRSGSLDVTAVAPSYFSLLKGEEKQGKFKIYNGGLTLSESFISFNLNKGRRQNGKPLVDPVKSRWFNSVAFRQAVAYGIDRQTMLTNIYQGLGKPQYSFVPVQSPYYLSPAEGLKVYDYNPAKAKELLLGAGFQYNAQGQLLDAEGNRVRFALITNAGNKIREAMGGQIKQDLSKLGIQVDFTPLAFNVLTEKLSTSLDWECNLLGFGGVTEPNNGSNIWNPEGGLHIFNQKPRAGQPPITGREVTDWERRIGDLFIQGAQELDEAKRKEIYGEVQQIVQENLPFIYLINPLSLGAVRDHLQGVQYSALGGALWNIYELKLTDD